MEVTCTVSPTFAAGVCPCSAFRKSLSSIFLPTSILNPFFPEGIGFNALATYPETYRTISIRDCGCSGDCLLEACSWTEPNTSAPGPGADEKSVWPGSKCDR